MTITVGGVDLSDASNVLVVGDHGQKQTRRACVELLSSGGESVRVLGVTYGGPSLELLDEFEVATNRWLAEATFVSVDGDVRGTKTETVDGTTIRTVGPADNLTGVAVAVSECLGACRERADTNDSLVLCFDSLTSMLDHVPRERAFRFLHVLTQRLDQSSAIAHFHVDPDVADEQTIATFSPLFDATVEVTPNGDLEIWG